MNSSLSYTDLPPCFSKPVSWAICIRIFLRACKKCTFRAPPQGSNPVGLRRNLRWFLCILKIWSRRTGFLSTFSKIPHPAPIPCLLDSTGALSHALNSQLGLGMLMSPLHKCEKYDLVSSLGYIFLQRTPIVPLNCFLH